MPAPEAKDRVHIAGMTAAASDSPESPGEYDPMVLGLDLGTSAVKVLAVGRDVQVLATGTAAFPTFSEVPDQAEQDPAEWLRAVGRAVADLDAALRSHRPDWRAGWRGSESPANSPLSFAWEPPALWGLR